MLFMVAASQYMFDLRKYFFVIDQDSVSVEFNLRSPGNDLGFAMEDVLLSQFILQFSFAVICLCCSSHFFNAVFPLHPTP